MRSETPMRAAKTAYIIISVLFCVLGAVLFVIPEVSLPWIGRLVGVSMIVFGVIKLTGYFSRDLFRLAFQYDLAFGILLIAVGIITLAHPGEAISFLCVMFGIPLLADGLFKIQISIDAKRFGIGSWWVVLSLALLTCIIGALLVLRPADGAELLTMLVGLALFLDGVLNLSVAVCTVKIIRHQRPDTIDADFKIK